MYDTPLSGTVSIVLPLCVQTRVLFSDHVYHNILYRLASKSVDTFFSVVCLGLGTAAEGSMLDQRVHVAVCFATEMINCSTRQHKQLGAVTY